MAEPSFLQKMLEKEQEYVNEHLPSEASSFQRNGCGCAIFLPLSLLSGFFLLLSFKDGFPWIPATIFVLWVGLCGKFFRRYRKIYKAAEDARKALKQQEIDFRDNTQRKLGLISEDTRAIGNTIASLSDNLRLLYQDALTRSVVPADSLPSDVRCDFFICHASEDKDDIVRELAYELRLLGAVVFYDEYSLRVGDNLSASLDKGLVSSKFGIVVLSEHFFRRSWSTRELGGLVALETAGRIRILPIWHKVSKDEVLAFSPMIADKVALSTAILTAKEMAIDLYSLLKK